MSWLSENYDKAALGVAAVVAIAVGYSVFSGGEKINAPKPAKPNNTVEMESRKSLAEAQERFSAEYGFDPKKSNDNEVQSFVAYPLYSIKDQKGLKSLTNDFEIHPGMKLEWWRKYNLEDYRWSDGPERDADKDGFSNREEKDGATDPTDSSSHPDFIAKLKCTAPLKDVPYGLSWTKLSKEQGNFTFRFRGSSSLNTLGVGGKFPDRSRKDKSFVNRFEIIEKGQDPDVPGEAGEYYLLQDNGKLQNKKQFKLYYSKRLELKDWTGTFMLDIDGARTPFDVPMGEKFSLPHDDKTKPKSYTFKSIKGNKVEIEYDVNGKKSSVELDVPPAK